MPISNIVLLDGLSPGRGDTIFVEALRSEEVRYDFGNPGTTDLPPWMWI